MPDGKEWTTENLNVERESSGDEHCARLEAHGLYWTASETSATSAWFYNFGKSGLSRHRNGSKQMAISVRCVRE